MTTHAPAHAAPHAEPDEMAAGCPTSHRVARRAGALAIALLLLAIVALLVYLKVTS